ncbi:MAG: 6-carboxytetrahydropterin synthase [bacterium]|nr:6-carboxytetrahydropterin synthase [bacterium]
MTRVKVGRIYHFSAAHRLHSPFLDPEENRALYRDCNNPGGHGHNYVLEVIVEGPVASRTGMAVDLVALDEAVKRTVLDRLDHRFIGWHDFPDPLPPEAFISTSEEITRLVWTWLAPVVPAPARLHAIRLEETRSNHFEYAGEDA